MLVPVETDPETGTHHRGRRRCQQTLACTAAAYAALADDATEADFARAVELCPAGPAEVDAIR